MGGATLYLLLLAGSLVLEVISMVVWKRATGESVRTDHFRFSRYLWYIVFPLVLTLLFVHVSGGGLWVVFIVGCAVGTILEWLIGWSYHGVVGQRLWTYHRYSLGGYTSVLSVPIWGMAAVLFALLGR